jgi:hydroxyacylglutathione hydrolase
VSLQQPSSEAPYAIEPFVAHELGNSSYLVADPAAGDAAVIDPLRDVDQYLERVREHGWNLLYALDTHIHNDFLSGGGELAAAGFGEHLHPSSNGQGAGVLRDGDELRIGALRLRALHTPGHTPEHLSFLLLRDTQPVALFSGGALMVGTIARPDLLGADHTFGLARQALATVREVLAPLPDGVEVFPTHGGGSFCGSSSGDRRTTSIGRERRDNVLMNQADFIDFLATYANQGEFPRYYEAMAPLNRVGAPLLGVPLPGLPRLEPERVEALALAGAALVDVRPHRVFDSGFVPGSLNAGIDGPLSAWVGWLLSLRQQCVLVAGTEEAAVEAQRMLVRIGMDSLPGWLCLSDWQRSGRTLAQMRRGTMADLAAAVMAGERLAVVDARQEREWVAGHVPGAVHALAPEVLRATAGLPDATEVAAYCSSGYRSSLAASLLAGEGRLNPWHIADGVDAWQRLGHPLTRPG